jgi:hypothetical protein
MGRIVYIDRRTRTRERSALLTDVLESVTRAVDRLSVLDDDSCPMLEGWQGELAEILHPSDRRILSMKGGNGKR